MGCDWAYPDDDDDGDDYNGDDYGGYYGYDSGGPSWSPADAAVRDAGDGGADAADASYPSIDGSVSVPDLAGCADGAAGLAYAITEDGVLSQLDGDTLTTTKLGKVLCPVSAEDWPVALTASRSGSLYALYMLGSMYEIDPATLSCTLTPWTSGTSAGIAISRTGGVEALSVLRADGDQTQALERADLATMTPALVGNVPILEGAPNALASDAYNRLFALTGPHLMQLDPTTGAVAGVDEVPGFTWSSDLDGVTGMVMGSRVYELAWRQDDTLVYRYDLVTKETTAVVKLPGAFTAAAAVPCAQ